MKLSIKVVLFALFSSTVFGAAAPLTPTRQAVVLVTAASSEVGRACCQAALDGGYTVIAAIFRDDQEYPTWKQSANNTKLIYVYLAPNISQMIDVSNNVDFVLHVSPFIFTDKTNAVAALWEQAFAEHANIIRHVVRVVGPVANKDAAPFCINTTAVSTSVLATAIPFESWVKLAVPSLKQYANNPFSGRSTWVRAADIAAAALAMCADPQTDRRVMLRGEASVSHKVAVKIYLSALAAGYMRNFAGAIGTDGICCQGRYS